MPSPYGLYEAVAGDRHTESGRSLISIRNKSGPSSELCGTPLVTQTLLEKELPNLTTCLRFCSYDFVVIHILPLTPKCHTWRRMTPLSTFVTSFFKINVHYFKFSTLFNRFLKIFHVNKSRFLKWMWILSSEQSNEETGLSGVLISIQDGFQSEDEENTDEKHWAKSSTVWASSQAVNSP